MDVGTTPEELLRFVERLDIRLWVEGGRLRYSAPEGALTPNLRALLQESKSTIMGLLADWDSGGPPASKGGFNAPSSFAQQHFWSLQQRDPSGCFFNVPFAFHLRGELDGTLLRRSFDKICRRHDLLRTTLRVIDGALVQVVTPIGEVNMAYADLRDCAPSTENDELDRLIRAELGTPFDLATESCVRVRLYRLAEKEHLLFLCLHNMIVDDRSVAALLKELSAHYEALGAQPGTQPASLPPLPMQYSEYARWQQSLLSTGLEARLAYWRRWFGAGEPPPLTSAFAKPAPAQPTYRAAAVWHRFPPELTERLRRLSGRGNVTLFVTILAAYAALLYRYSGCTDVAVGGPAANRSNWKLEPLIGSTLSLVAYRFDLTGDPDAWTLLKRVHDGVVAALTHQDVPFVAVAPLVEPGHQRANPLFRTAFNFSQETPHRQLQLPGVEVRFLEEVTNREIRPDLFPVIWEDQLRNGALTCCLLYRRELFDAGAVEQMLADYEALLTAMVDDPMQTIDAVRLGRPSG